MKENKGLATVAILIVILLAALWLHSRLNELKAEMSVIKNVLMIKGIMPHAVGKGK